jgi:hypothetical protein
MMRPFSIRWLVPLTLVVLLLPGCGYSADDAVAPGSGDSTPADDATVVVGSGVCDMTSVSEEAVDGVDVIVEHFVCEDEMSDPRVSGTEDMMVVSRVADYSTGGTWTAQDTTLTNDGGTWRGSMQGVVDLAGVHPFAEGVRPFNYGEAHYIGEGAYDGLEYHYYISGSNGTAGVTGWIQPAD